MKRGINQLIPVTEKTEHIKVINEYLNQNRLITNEIPYTLKNKTFIISPNVYSPTIFKDTDFYIETFNYQKDIDFLEIGCGTGIISVFWALNGAKKIAATDINKDAIKNTIKNFKSHRVIDKLDVYEGDKFEPLPPNQKFDVIFWNLPFVYKNSNCYDILDKAVFDFKYKNLDAFLKSAGSRLKESGHILFGFSKSSGHLQVLKYLVEKYGWKIEIVAEKIFDDEFLGKVSIELYKALR